jgi:hypothetical protein
LQHTAVENGRGRLSFAAFDLAQQRQQVLETARCQPAVRLLIDDVLGRQIMRKAERSRHYST